MTKLTLKQERFVHNYTATGNGTQSAVDAGYSPDSARFIASENLSKPNVKAEVDRIRTIAQAEAILTVAQRKALLSDIALKGDRLRTNPVEAVREINRMEGVYPPTEHRIASKVIFEVYHTDRMSLPAPIDGTVRVLPASGDLPEALNPA